MKMRLSQIAVATTLALGLSTAAISQTAQPADQKPVPTRSEQRAPHAHPHGAGPHAFGAADMKHQHAKRFEGARQVRGFFKDLNLTEEQRDRIFAIHHASAPKVREAIKALSKARRDLRELARTDKFDEARAQELANAAAQAYAELQLLRAKDSNAILAVLTPDQRQKLQERHEKRTKRQAPNATRS